MTGRMRMHFSLHVNGDRLRKAARTAIVALGIMAAGSCVAYCNDYPPPWRLAVPSQRAEFGRLKRECERYPAQRFETGTQNPTKCAERTYRCFHSSDCVPL